MFRRIPILCSLALLTFGCTAASSVVPTLGAVLSRVDVPRLVACGKHLPDYGAAAKCLGAEAATQGLRLALDKALELAEDAQLASGPTGADDYTDDEREALGADLDQALDALAVEIDATHGPG